jgi:HD-GYP domain-containing protein (c-di-GMP phosphodiesterase class II)
MSSEPAIYPGNAQVIVISGPLAGSVLDISDELTIGRRPENTLRLRDDQVSRYHARIERIGDSYFVEDLGSRTGTLVDGRAVRGRMEINEGSHIVIGQTILRFTRQHDEPFGHEVTEPRGMIGMPPGKDPRVVTLVPADAGPLSRAGEHLQMLLTANQIIASELDLEKLFEKILDQIFGAFPVHRAVIMTSSENGERLAVRASRMAKDIALDAPVSQTIVRRAFRDRVAVLTYDAGLDARFDTHASIVDMNIRSAICVPMIHQEQVLGVIYLDTMGITHAFKEDDLRLLTGIAGPAAGAVKNAVLHARLKATAIDTILRLAVAAEYRDDDTGFHIHRMSDYAEAIARALGKPDEFNETLKHAAPMHDVGKIGIPDSILKKPGKLTREEFEEMKLHTVKGGAILANSDSDLLRMAWYIAMTHHEKFDGSGYPHGLAGEAIPIEGRIVAVADVFDAVTTRRCYKHAFALEEAFKILTDGRGQHFDPVIVDCFFNIKDEILRIREHYLSLEAAQEKKGLPASAPLMRPLSISTPG